MNKLIVSLVGLVLSVNSFGFTEVETAAAYKKLSACSSSSTENRHLHLSYVKQMATEDDVLLSIAAEKYNRMNCITYDLAMIEIAKNIISHQGNFTNLELLDAAVRVFDVLKSISHHPSGILKDTFKTFIVVVEKSDSIESAFETYVDVFSTVSWDNHTTEDKELYYSYSDSSKQAQEAERIYKYIWGL